MKFGGRLKYYLVGFSIGIIACLIIFKGRGCEWLPNERVLNTIQSSNIYYTSQDSCLMAENGISKKDIFLLLQNGDVNFGESNTDREIATYRLNNVNTEAELKTYVIEYNNLKLSLDLFELDSVVFISKINGLETSARCSELPDFAKAMYLPNDMTLEKLSSNKIRFEKDFICEMECYGITKSDINSLFISGEVLFNNSYPNKKPNPLYYIKKELKGKTYIFKIAQGATKTRLERIIELKENIDKSKTYAVDILFPKEPCFCNQ
mgnify:CR=1 FL=1